MTGTYKNLDAWKKSIQLYHFDIAFGSCNEVDNLSTLALEIGYINEEVQKEIEEIIISIRRPLSGLIKYTENKIQNFKT